jgi:hypothetical protein
LSRGNLLCVAILLGCWLALLSFFSLGVSAEENQTVCAQPDRVQLPELSRVREVGCQRHEQESPIRYGCGGGAQKILLVPWFFASTPLAFEIARRAAKPRGN